MREVTELHVTNAALVLVELEILEVLSEAMEVLLAGRWLERSRRQDVRVSVMMMGAIVGSISKRHLIVILFSDEIVRQLASEVLHVELLVSLDSLLAYVGVCGQRVSLMRSQAAVQRVARAAMKLAD